MGMQFGNGGESPRLAAHDAMHDETMSCPSESLAMWCTVGRLRTNREAPVEECADWVLELVELGKRATNDATGGVAPSPAMLGVTPGVTQTKIASQ